MKGKLAARSRKGNHDNSLRKCVDPKINFRISGAKKERSRLRQRENSTEITRSKINRRNAYGTPIWKRVLPKQWITNKQTLPQIETLRLSRCWGDARFLRTSFFFLKKTENVTKEWCLCTRAGIKYLQRSIHERAATRKTARSPYALTADAEYTHLRNDTRMHIQWHAYARGHPQSHLRICICARGYKRCT